SALALVCDDAPATAVCPAPLTSAPRCAESDLPATALANAPHRAGRFSACALPWLGFSPHLPATTRARTPPAAARTRDSARKLPSLPALSAPPENGKTAPPRRGDSAVFPDTPQFACQRSRPAETPDENHSL